MKKRKTTMSVSEMQHMLGLQKTDAYWLVHQHLFDTIIVEKKIRVVLASFEKWYANQLRRSKVNGPPPGTELRSCSVSVKEMAELLGISDDTAYAIIRRDRIETFEVDHRRRIRKDTFEKWYNGQTKYIKQEDRPQEEQKKLSLMWKQQERPQLTVDPDKPSYSIKETAILLNLAETEVRRMIRSGELEAKKYGQRYLILKAEIEWWLLQQKSDTDM